MLSRSLLVLDQRNIEREPRGQLEEGNKCCCHRDDAEIRRREQAREHHRTDEPYAAIGKLEANHPHRAVRDPSPYCASGAHRFKRRVAAVAAAYPPNRAVDLGPCEAPRRCDTGSRKARRKRRHRKYPAKCFGHVGRARWRHEHRRLPVLDEMRNPADVRADDRHAARHRLEQRDRHVVGKGRVERNARGPVERRQLAVVEPPREAHSLRHTELGGQPFEFGPLGTGAGDRHPCPRKAFQHHCEGPDRRGDVVDRLEIAGDQDVRFGRRRVGRAECRQIHDVRHFHRLDAALREYLAQEPGRDHDDRSTCERGTNGRELALEKGLGLPSPIVDDDRCAADRSHPDRGCREEMPRPTRIRHDVHDVRADDVPPQPEQVRHEPDQCANDRNLPDPRRCVGCVGLDNADVRALGCEQAGELARLIRHAARGRWQRPDERQAARCRNGRCTRRRRTDVHHGLRRRALPGFVRDDHAAARSMLANTLRASRAPHRPALASHGVKRGSSNGLSVVRAAPGAVENAAANPAALTMATCRAR